MLASTLLISVAPNPVAVLLCFGLVKSGPTGPLRSEMGALVEGLLWRVWVAILKNLACRINIDYLLRTAKGSLLTVQLN